MFRFTRSGESPAAPLKTLSPAVLPARRDGARSADEFMSAGGKAGRMQRRSLLQAASSTRLEASWSTMPESPDSLIFKNLRTLVARSRNQFMENDYPKNFVRMVKKNVAGPNGIRVRSMPRNPDGKLDVPAKDAIEEAWKEQSLLGNWEVTGSMSRATFEQLWIGTIAIDGEALALIVNGPDAGPTAFALQMIDTMRLDPSHNESLSDGRYIRAGIEYNAAGRAVAYHIADDTPDTGHLYSAYPGTRRQRYEASRVIHAYVPELAGQRRGFPWMHTALWRLRNLKGFEDAAVVNARVGASKMGLISNKDADEEDDEDIEIDAEPGTFQDIGNREIHDWSPQFPETSTEPFMKQQLRGIASGLGVSYNNLANDLNGVNYSSLRSGTLDERDTWMVLQEWMISTLVRRIYLEWLSYAILKGSILVRGRPLRVDKIDKYKAAEFKGRRWAWIDPKSEIMAAKMAVETRLASRTKYIEDQSDGDAWDTFDQIRQEEEDMEEMGIQIMTTPGAGVIGGKNEPSDDE